MRFLVKRDGTIFKQDELLSLRDELSKFDDSNRVNYRNQNATVISQDNSKKFLIVSGPGTGKSFLFLKKIEKWFKDNENAKIFVTSFVRKLVADLQTDINGDKDLTNEQKSNITASTLHKCARRIVELNHGTNDWRFLPYFRIIGQQWKDIVWCDVLGFFPELKKTDYSWEEFEKQLYTDAFIDTEEWKNLKYTYFKICKFFNAAGFADLILRARDALIENPKLIDKNYFIIDEYQDFNEAENSLLNHIANDPSGLLIVGDDEQVLYEKLKSGKPNLIRDLYKNQDYANGMLPFCGRSSHHITKTAGHFMLQCQEPDCIEKIYLPLKNSDSQPKVQVIACPSANSAVDYIEKFVADNKDELDERKRKLENGEEKDAFLLILTPRKIEKFYTNKNFDGKKLIDELISDYKIENNYFSEDYYKVLNFYSLVNRPENNYTFRKLLHYENISETTIHQLIEIAIKENINFCNLNTKDTNEILKKSEAIKKIIDDQSLFNKEKIEKIEKIIFISNKKILEDELNLKIINQNQILNIEHQEDEDAELEEIEIKKMSTIELMSIVGSKGLSAEHVIIIGFDDVNMGWITKNAFYVALTRARQSLHIITALKSGGANKPHEFLEQLPDEHVECCTYKKSSRVKNQLTNKQELKKYLKNLTAWMNR